MASASKWRSWVRSSVIALLAVAGALVSTGCGESERPRNLLLISIDTLRRDTMKVYDQKIPMELTPNLDRWARKGIILDRCFVPAPRTSQSFASLFTGKTPSNNGVFGLFHELPDAETTLAERLRDHGYRTSAIVTNAFLTSGRGFEQGFELYDDFLVRAESEYAENVTDRAERLTMDMQTDDPFFMWVHFFDPHWRYDPPTQILRKLHLEFTAPFTVYDDIDSSRIPGGELIFENDLDAETRKHMRRRYLGEVNYADGHIGRLLGILEARGLLDDTVVVLYSDHGESLGEHDYYYAHGERLYEPTVHVPAVIIAPGTEPSRYRGLVSSEDFLPTLFEIMDLPAPEGLDGSSFWSSMQGNEPPPRTVVYLESDYQLIHPENREFQRPGPEGKMRAVVSDGFKLIRVPLESGERYELYDLADDPWETRNLVDARPDVVTRLRVFLDEHDRIVDAQQSRPAEMDDHARERIRALGYVN